jgi:hypothetical protein
MLFNSLSAVVQCIAGRSRSCLELPDKKLEGLTFNLLSRSDFLNLSTRCSVKCPRGYKLFFDPILIVDLACSLISTLPCFAAVPSPVLKADSLFIAWWSWPC